MIKRSLALAVALALSSSLVGCSAEPADGTGSAESFDTEKKSAVVEDLGKVPAKEALAFYDASVASALAQSAAKDPEAGRGRRRVERVR